jgi:hypothetical protein
MAFGGPARFLVSGVNAVVSALREAPIVGPMVRKQITSISYTGRKSGKTFSLPVGYRRSGDVVTIRVGMPDQKNWWRNFLGTGAALTLELDGSERRAHAVATRDAAGQVTVVATLDQPAAT